MILPSGEFTWGAAGAWASFLALCGVIVRQVGPWRKQSIDAEQIFRDGLMARVQKLEDDLENERKDAKADREAQQIRHDAERALERHRTKNLSNAFTALIMLLKKGVSVEEAILEVEKMRAEHLELETAEAALMHEDAIPTKKRARK